MMEYISIKWNFNKKQIIDNVILKSLARKLRKKHENTLNHNILNIKNLGADQIFIFDTQIHPFLILLDYNYYNAKLIYFC